MITAGLIRSTSGVIIIPIEKEFGWTRATVSSASALSLLVYGFSGPFVAALIEKYGVKRMMTIGMIVLVAGTGATTFVQQAWQFILLWGIVVGSASGVFLTVLGTTISNRWFVKHRGMALGILTASGATGQLLFLPLLAYLSSNFSWRMAIYVIVGLGIMSLPLILLFMKNRPSDIGVAPLGGKIEAENNGTNQNNNNNNNNNPIRSAFAALKIGVKHVDFWLLAGSFFICGLSTTGLIATHFIPACMSHGIPEVTAAGLLSTIGVFDIIGVTLSGWLTDRFSSRWLLFWYYGLRGLALLFLPQALYMDSYMMLIVFAVFYGLDWVATVPPTVKLTMDAFGKEQGGIMYGWILASHQIGAGIAAFGGGLLFTIQDTYLWTFVLAGIFCLLATIIVLRIGKVKQLAMNFEHNAKADSL